MKKKRFWINLKLFSPFVLMSKTFILFYGLHNFHETNFFVCTHEKWLFEVVKIRETETEKFICTVIKIARYKWQQQRRNLQNIRMWAKNVFSTLNEKKKLLDVIQRRRKKLINVIEQEKFFSIYFLYIILNVHRWENFFYRLKALTCFCVSKFFTSSILLFSLPSLSLIHSFMLASKNKTRKI